MSAGTLPARSPGRSAAADSPRRGSGSRRSAGEPGAGVGRWAWVLVPTAFLAVFFAIPLVEIVAQTFLADDGAAAGLANWTHVLSSRALWSSLGTTLWVAAVSTAGCLVVGGFLAFVLAFVPFPGARAIRRLIETVVSFPSFLIPLAFTILYGKAGVLSALLTGVFGDAAPAVHLTNSAAGVVLAEITFYTPFVVGPVLAAFSRVPREQLDVAGSLGAGPLGIVRSVVIPEALPAIGAATVLTFLLTMNEFGIVLFTGAKDVITLPMQIYTNSIVTFDFGTASVMATVQILLSVGIYLFYRRATARWTSGRTDRR